MQAELNREGKRWKAAGDGNIKGRRRIKRSVIDERKRYRTVLFRGNQLEQHDIRYLIHDSTKTFSTKRFLFLSSLEERGDCERERERWNIYVSRNNRAIPNCFLLRTMFELRPFNSHCIYIRYV